MLNSVYDLSRSAGTVDQALLNCDSYIEELVRCYKNQMSKEEAFCMALCVGNGLENDDESSLTDRLIARHISCKGADVLKLNPHLNALFKKGIVNRRSFNRNSKSSFAIRSAFDTLYYVTANQLDAIVNGKIDIVNGKKTSTVDLYFRRLGELHDSADDLDFTDLLEMTTDLFLSNEHLMVNQIVLDFISLSRKKTFYFNDVFISEENEDLMVEIMLLLLLVKHARSNNSVCLNELVEHSMGGIYAYLYDTSQSILDRKHLLLTGNYLVKNNEMELIAEDGIFTFSKRFYKFFKIKDSSSIDLKGEKNDDLLDYKSIKPQTLFFNDALQIQLDELLGLLHQKNFLKTTSILKTKFKKPGGITILLHGEPGTGKTEFALQLAKATKRNVFRIDLSAMKSMWYGRSEQLLKQVFQEYKSLCDDKRVIPIMFINEADGLLGRRLNVEHSIDQTNNTIQNILLEEIEKFEGIFVCTTNLIQNLDSAFDRRFLFKIKFEFPDKTVQAKLWKHHFNDQLSKNDIERLTSTYSLSPAQIENISHKTAVQKIILGQKFSMDVVNQLAAEERLVKATKIGF